MASIFSPIARSNTVRNKPRSPAPPQPATPRPFLPPSHYAAAGGFSISLLNKPGEQGIDAVGPKTCRRDHSPRIHSKNPAHIPRTPQIPESESSPGINSVEEFPSRMNSYLRGETSRPGIPNLETQLLPSLKDTIDRMTRPPSASFNSVPGYLNDGHREHRKQRKRISPEPMTTPTQQHIFTKSASKHRKSPIANELTTPNLPQTYSNQSTPTMWNHPSRTKTPVKSALKSSLRSPTPKLFTPDTSATPTSMASPSFKSVKNLLSRKTSGTRESPNTDQVSRKWSFKVLLPVFNYPTLLIFMSRILKPKIHPIPSIFLNRILGPILIPVVKRSRKIHQLLRHHHHGYLWMADPFNLIFLVFPPSLDRMVLIVDTILTWKVVTKQGHEKNTN